ncbi:6-phosphofructokinase [Acidihalobacter prosperus]
MSANLLYAQSGGVTSVINASAAGVIQAARAWPDRFGKVFAAHNGIIGALTEQLFDLSFEREQAIADLRHQPGGAFGSCRYDLEDIKTHRPYYERLIRVFSAHDIEYFFYNGGGGSMLTAQRLLQVSAQLGYPLRVIGIPKTIDNDLPETDTSPGFGSAAKYVAVSTREAAFDVASMAGTSTKVFILEVMGRSAGWLAAAGGLAESTPGELPLLLLFAERNFHEPAFLNAVQARINSHGYCVIVASEGLRDDKGSYPWADTGASVAVSLASLVRKRLGYRAHWSVADYLQRSARHIASSTDLDQAYACGSAGVRLAAEGADGLMVTLKRMTDVPYRWETASTALSSVADQECPVPDQYISQDGFGITELARRYLRPLIQGEAFPPFREGIPYYERLQLKRVETQLPAFKME